MEPTHLFFGIASGAGVAGAAPVAVGVVIAAAVRVGASISGWSAATSPSAPSRLAIADIERLFLSLAEPDGVDVGFGVVVVESGSEG